MHIESNLGAKSNDFGSVFNISNLYIIGLKIVFLNWKVSNKTR